ncbi:MAG: hypothetical protein K2N80_00550, partial [Lachnospiraceae bacterium]|nr:hypothetical protein [Lachnospiraceae bacterium]
VVPQTPYLRDFSAFRVRICRKLRHLMVPRLLLSAQDSNLASTHTFYRLLLSLKGSAKSEQFPQQKKGPKSKKTKPQNQWKSLFPHISAVFCCINSAVAIFPYTYGHLPYGYLKLLGYIISSCGSLV